MVVVVAVATDFQPETSTKKCAKKCGSRCIVELLPGRIALCFVLCMIKCKLVPTQVVYNCTSDCANSFLHNNPNADRKEVRLHVDQCYERCRNKI
ncbi:hypothetical protein ES319_D09G094400v1 [Gossypium barbadense]|uniref:Uncharacterized protein n=4 Tax=Gossypium TaxID=3633 RepID=A0A0D2NPK3_GOSRA|nr:hypothetical protein ES319_D09G094400v1 [Gossypium barbadense]KJB35082.1 hypothetical protein B456_006G099300 [Gossypium raimondii]PPD95653.1 hypothetical protein GOBAR_DD07352 [Gossypium barbadense]TYG53421.1 hypothetical protein ES288_D09G108500v1 [Gossypium darwinii]TYH53487.1 hypothetical protein ES332_D09G103600v1 [Gossypium tomentosum]